MESIDFRSVEKRPYGSNLGIIKSWKIQLKDFDKSIKTVPTTYILPNFFHHSSIKCSKSYCVLYPCLQVDKKRRRIFIKMLSKLVFNFFFVNLREFIQGFEGSVIWDFEFVWFFYLFGFLRSNRTNFCIFGEIPWVINHLL